MPRTRKVTTVCNGKREFWTDYEEAKAYFLEMMMSTEGEERDRAECVYIQLTHGLSECSDEDYNQHKGFAEMQSLLLCPQTNGNAPQSCPLQLQIYQVPEIRNRLADKSTRR